MNLFEPRILFSQLGYNWFNAEIPNWRGTTALWANTWTFFKKSTLFFDITSLPIFSLCLPHLHNVIRDIFLSEIDETQKKILGLEVLGFDAILQYIAGNREIRENV